MVVAVEYERGQRPRWPIPSLWGDGLLERARSVFMGLIGLTAAIVLGIVVVALNQGWPDFPPNPIPESQAGHGAGSATEQGVGAARPLGSAGTAGATVARGDGAGPGAGGVPLESASGIRKTSGSGDVGVDAAHAVTVRTSTPARPERGGATTPAGTGSEGTQAAPAAQTGASASASAASPPGEAEGHEKEGGNGNANGHAESKSTGPPNGTPGAGAAGTGGSSGGGGEGKALGHHKG